MLRFLTTLVLVSTIVCNIEHLQSSNPFAALDDSGDEAPIKSKKSNSKIIAPSSKPDPKSKPQSNDRNTAASTSNISDDISDEDTINLMYGEAFDKKLYREWKKGEVIPVPFAVPVSAAALAHLSDGVKARLCPSYLNVNFAAWQQTSVAPGTPTLPTLASTLVNALDIICVYFFL